MRKHELVDMETGEVVPAMVWVRRAWKGAKYFMGFQEAFEYLATDKELTLEPKNVLLYLLSKLDFENYILVPQVEIAEKLSMHKSHVSRAIQLLVDKGILLEGPKANRSRTFRLNHTYGWKGSLKNLKRLRVVENQQK